MVSGELVRVRRATTSGAMADARARSQQVTRDEYNRLCMWR